MWIEHERAADPDCPNGINCLRHDELTNGEWVEFSDNGTAQVPEDVGEVLVDAYDAIVPKGGTDG